MEYKMENDKFNKKLVVDFISIKAISEFKSEMKETWTANNLIDYVSKHITTEFNDLKLYNDLTIDTVLKSYLIFENHQDGIN